MSYTPTEWQSGDVITSSKLNHIEDGIEEISQHEALQPFVVEVVNGATPYLDVTRVELYEAYNSGRLCLAHDSNITGGYGVINSMTSSTCRYEINGRCYEANGYTDSETMRISSVIAQNSMFKPLLTRLTENNVDMLRINADATTITQHFDRGYNIALYYTGQDHMSQISFRIIAYVRKGKKYRFFAYGCPSNVDEPVQLMEFVASSGADYPIYTIPQET